MTTENPATEIVPTLPEITIVVPGEVTITTASDLDQIKAYLIQRWGVMRALQRRTALEFYLIGRAVFLGQKKLKAARQFTRWMEKNLPFSPARGYDAMTFFRAVAGDDINYDPSDILAGWTITKAQEVYGLVEPKKMVTSPTTTTPTPTTTTPTPTPTTTTPTAPAPSSPATPMVENPREQVVRDLEARYGGSVEPFHLELPVTVFRLVGYLASQEEATEVEVVTRAVREYWLRHGDPTQLQERSVGLADPETIYTQVTQ